MDNAHERGRLMNSDGQALDTALADERAADEPAFVVDVEGFEGPLDLLLALARQQKVDLAKISILALADQYLAFIEEARKLRLELAADYLLMAAWLAYLKSRLLLPDVTSEEGQNAAAREKESGADHRAQFCRKPLSKPEGSSAWRMAGESASRASERAIEITDQPYHEGANSPLPGRA